jgi:hypothetical protein
VFAYFGHHKCGSRWIVGILDEVCAELGLRSHEHFLARTPPGELAAVVRAERPDFVYYTNAVADTADEMGPVRGFHVVRDPRDILVSAYFSHLHSHPVEDWPQLSQIREHLQRRSRSSGLLESFVHQQYQFRQMAAWRPRPGVREVRMEELTAAPEDGFVDVLDSMGLVGHGERQVSEATVRRIVHANRFEVLSGGRAAGQEDETDHYRKGVAGDWVEHFEFVHAVSMAAQWNHLLLGLGYETDPDWWRAFAPRAVALAVS